MPSVSGSTLNQQRIFEQSRPRAVQDAITALSAEGSDTERGAVFTKAEVVDGILDLAGYTADRELWAIRLLEPSCGSGDFIVRIVERLIDSCRKHGIAADEWPERLTDAVTAVELHAATIGLANERAAETLRQAGLSSAAANALIDRWFVSDDFLLHEFESDFDCVVGNPPYVRQERIPADLLRVYRQRYSTFFDRADLYVAFFERGLDLLSDSGTLAYICANRWVKNRYGGPLRAKIASDFGLACHIDLTGRDAFDRPVDAYPAITVIRRESHGITNVVGRGEHEGVPIRELISSALRSERSGLSVQVSKVAVGNAPWLVDAPAMIPIIRELEDRFCTLEATGAKVGIGVATGADRVFIRPRGELDVEPSRLLPLAVASDVSNSGVRHSGKELLNPWDETGALVEPAAYPRFLGYLSEHEATLRGRHVAKKSPKAWFRTIDKVDCSLVGRPKLLIPDIKGAATVGYDEGRFYPHHNLYVVTSDIWDLRVLQAFLQSSLSVLFVAAYCVRMSGGFLRFQAQYLRRIRLPGFETLSAAERGALRSAVESNSAAAVDEAVFAVLNLPKATASKIRAFASVATNGRSAGV